MRYSLHVNIRQNGFSGNCFCSCGLFNYRVQHVGENHEGLLLDRQDQKTSCLHQYYDPAKYFTCVIISMLFSELKLMCSL